MVCDCYRAGHACLHRALACGMWCSGVAKKCQAEARSWWMVMMIDDKAVPVNVFSVSAKILRARTGGTGDSVASLLLSQQEAAPNTQLSHAASAARTILCVYEGRTLPAPAVHAKPVAYVPRTGGRATACPEVANQAPPFQRAAPTCAWMPATSPYRAAGPIVTQVPWR